MSPAPAAVDGQELGSAPGMRGSAAADDILDVSTSLPAKDEDREAEATTERPAAEAPPPAPSEAGVQSPAAGTESELRCTAATAVPTGPLCEWT